MRITPPFIRGRSSTVLAAALALSLALTACAASPPDTPDPKASASIPVSPSPSTSGSAASNDPFSVVASFSAKSLGLSKPAGLAVGPEGNAYVTDAGQRISVVSPVGKVLRRWGRHGKAPGEFSFIKHDNADDVPNVSAPIAVAPDGTVYVADTGNARIQVFTAEGRFLRQFGHYGRDPGAWLFPAELAVDPGGSLYVFDDTGLALWKFSPSGEKEWMIRASATTDDDLAGHLHLAGVDDHHRLVATVDENYHLIYLDGRGHKVDVVDLHDVGAIQEGAYYAGPCGSSLGPDATVYITSCQEPLQPPHDLTVVDRAHQLAAVWLRSPLAWPPRFGPHGEIFSIRDTDGALLKLSSSLGGR
jgi:hypothetical protein